MTGWLNRLRQRLGHDDPYQLADFETEDQMPREALENAQKALDSARAQREAVREVTSSLADLRERNHFAESIQLAMMPREN